MLAYMRARVPHYWVIDPIAETLIVSRWTDEGYLLVHEARGGAYMRRDIRGRVVLGARPARWHDD